MHVTQDVEFRRSASSGDKRFPLVRVFSWFIVQTMLNWWLSTSPWYTNWWLGSKFLFGVVCSFNYLQNLVLNQVTSGSLFIHAIFHCSLESTLFSPVIWITHWNACNSAPVHVLRMAYECHGSAIQQHFEPNRNHHKYQTSWKCNNEIKRSNTKWVIIPSKTR